MAWYHSKKFKKSISFEILKDFTEWGKLRKSMNDAIKNNKLTIEMVNKYLDNCNNIKKKVLKNSDKIINENTKINEKKIKSMIQDLDVQIKWCKSTINVDEELKEKFGNIKNIKGVK